MIRLIGAVMLALLGPGCGRAVDSRDAGSDGGVAGGQADGGDGGSSGEADAGAGCVPLAERGEWKLKFVLLVEQSRTMCMVDPPGAQQSNGLCEQVAAVRPPGVYKPHRTRALEEFLGSVQSRTDVRVALVPFETRTRGQLAFAPESSRPFSNVLWSVQTLQTELGQDANLQDALTVAADLIEHDLVGLSDLHRPRTRYVVVVLSTGVPSPRCSADDRLAEYASPSRPELVWADVDAMRCNGSATPTDPLGVSFLAGNALNQNSQLQRAVDRLKAMSTWYGGAPITVHARMVLSEASVGSCGALCDGQLTNGLSATDLRRVGTYVMRDLATRTGGTFLDPGEPANLTLMDLAALEPAVFCDD